MANSPAESRPDLRLERTMLVAGAIAAAIAIVIAVMQWQTFCEGYLAGLFLWIGAGFGGSYLLMTHHLTGGRWGWWIRRLLESLSLSVVPLALLFVPLLFGVRVIYPWTQGQTVHPHAVDDSWTYLNVPFFVTRSVVYAAIWCVVTLLLYRWSTRQDRDDTVDLQRRLTRISSFGLIAMILTVSFAAIDWIASANPHWPSTVFGLYVVAGQTMTALSLIIILMSAAPQLEPERTRMSPDRWHDLGNLQLLVVILYAYLAYAQYFIIWNGNLPHEITWYVQRQTGGWLAVVALLAILHFLVPFAALLFRSVKRNPRSLAAVAWIVLAARMLDSAWFVLPSFERTTWLTILTLVVVLIGVGGLWMGLVLWHVRQRQAVALALVSRGASP